MVPSNSVKIFHSEICTDIKNTSIVSLVVQKVDFWGSTLGGSPGGGGHPQIMSKYLSVVSADIKIKTGVLVGAKKKVFKRSILEGPRGGIPKRCQNIRLLDMWWYFEKTSALAWANQKIDLWGVCFREVPGGWHPKLCQSIRVQHIYCWYQKTLASYLKSFKELVLGGIPERGDTPKSRQIICILNTYWQQKTLAP